jgi:hypothetical protein
MGIEINMSDSIEKLIDIAMKELQSFKENLPNRSMFKETSIPRRVNEIQVVVSILKSIIASLKAGKGMK